MICVIAGPTASGKTALALQLAEEWGAEIVGADSQQVYRHFDLGTAKPSADELKRVPHHLIDVVDPLEAFSAAKYQALADAAIAQVQKKGRPVIVVGGTGLYLRVLLHGVVEAAGSDAVLRAELEKETNASLHAKLAGVDPVTAARLPVADRVRIIRALEIHTLTGQPASAQRQAHGFAQQRYPHRLVVLNPPREQLYAAINLRTQKLYDKGLIDETRALLERGFGEAAPMRSVGYPEARQVLDGQLTVEAAVALTAQRTRNYAKRQLTWFKKEPNAQLLEPAAALTALRAGRPSP